ncbi:proline dehydrogenase family protein [Paenibacillus turpanensis]|uniref:proline dehydrogenase family protein n=1 Tax=Paenibacillus turpanensis TaxID=2689078 RepID=UPI00140A9BBD|nr:proline dehydrogenase family protein [Paenibacillus turpanensis]
MTGLMRKLVLTAAGNKAVSGFFQKYGMRIGVQRFVAAEQLELTVEAVKQLNRQGLLVTLDYLGESVSSREMADEAADMVLRTMDAIRDHRLNSNVSVKLTQLGLLIDPALCLAQMKKLLAHAKSLGQFVRIDMEDSPVTDITIKLFLELFEQYGADTVGLVLQSYLYRTAADRKQLAALGANLRVVKGAYKEPKEVAFPAKADVDRSYIELCEAHMEDGCYTAVATHDERIIQHIIQFTEKKKIPRDRFEFQMLYGISSSLQLRLVEQGYRVRVYTPYGEQWYPYFSRRIAERPANLWFVIRGFFRK